MPIDICVYIYIYIYICILSTSSLYFFIRIYSRCRFSRIIRVDLFAVSIFSYYSRLYFSYFSRALSPEMLRKWFLRI